MLSPARPLEEGIDRLAGIVASGNVVVLTGAGVSTDSGIPDYRDDRGEWKQRQPMDIREFLGSVAARQRYWARSSVGFQRIRDVRPNGAHHALTELERQRLTSLLVTQNVDGLHQAAGSSDVIDLHGRLDRVVCLTCAATQPRDALQRALTRLNPDWSAREMVATPDGDAELGDVDYASFRVVDCERCGGILKPDVVFFGERVPPPRVARAMLALESARALLVVGSSLMVFSGFRFPRAAVRLGVPIVVVNRGRTRADELSALKIEGNAADVLTELSRRVRVGAQRNVSQPG